MTDHSAPTTRTYIPRQLCEVRDGRFVDPCGQLVNSPFVILQTLDMRTKTPIKMSVGTWSSEQFMPFRVCPFCSSELPKP